MGTPPQTAPPRLAAAGPAEAEGGPSLAGEQVLWFLVAWFPGVMFWPLNLLAEIPVWLTIRRLSPRAARWNLGLSSSVVIPLLSLLLTAAWYPSGRAVRLVTGLMPRPSRHLDPYTRLYARSLGCTGDPTNGLIQLPNWAAIYGLRALCGPPPGAYTGPYPTQASCAGALEHGSRIPVAAVEAGRFSVGDVPIELTPAAVRRLNAFTDLPLRPIRELQAAVVDQRCLVLGLVDAGQVVAMVLVDLQTGKPFNYYYGFWPREDELSPPARISP